METRRLGRIAHQSTVAIFGAASLSNVSQDEADTSIQFAIDQGINHFDTAASYGDAELRLGPWMKQIRSSIFLATKTGERSKEAAKRQIEDSLKRLQVDYVDLLQLHAIGDLEELDKATAHDGALYAAIEAKEQGLVREIGITGHGHLAPKTHLEGLRRYPFATVLTPYNYLLAHNATYKADFDALVAEIKRQDAGLMTIKTAAKAPWAKPEAQRYATWYEPFDEQKYMDAVVSFSLSNPNITGLASPGDIRLLPLFVQAAKNWRSLTADEIANRLEVLDAAYASPFGSF